MKVCECALKGNKEFLGILEFYYNSVLGPNTKSRLLVANLALSASGLNSTTEIRKVLQQLGVFSNFTTLVKTACDCSVLYWHFSYVMPVYFSKLVASKSNLAKCYVRVLQYLPMVFINNFDFSLY